MRVLTLMLLVACCVYRVGAQAQQASAQSVEALFAQLKDPQTSVEAAHSLTLLGRKRSAAREYISEHLPAAIEDSSGEVRKEAIELAGDLKIKTAVPVLASFLRFFSLAGRTDLEATRRLENDPAGRALVEIGEPAVPAVTQVLEQGNKQARWRAALILMSIGTPVAKQAVRNHIPEEKDPRVRDFIASHVEGAGSGPAAAGSAPTSGPPTSTRGESLELRVPAADQVSSSLAVVSPSDGDFGALLDEHFPGVSGMPNFQNLRPYLLLVRNDTALPAVAYAIRWDIAYAHGGTKTSEKYYVLRPLDQDPITALPVGSVRLISPLFNVTPLEYRTTGNFRELYSGPLPPAASVSASVEGVVYRGGKYSGLEGPEIWIRFVTSKFAAHDEAVSVISLLKSGATLPDLISTLKLQILRGLWLHGTDAMDAYVYARGKSAQDVKTLILRSGQNGALQRLTRFAGSPAVMTVFGRYY